MKRLRIRFAKDFDLKFDVDSEVIKAFETFISDSNQKVFRISTENAEYNILKDNICYYQYYEEED